MSLVYRRLVGRDTWHFHKDCHHGKAKLWDVFTTTKPRSGEFCNECQAKARADKRTQARKRGK